jgi:hypothetical protein
MTRSKLELAIILASLRGDGSKPQQLAADMSLRKLCYEIEKIEEENEARAKKNPPKPEPKQDSKSSSFWSFLSSD